MSRPMKNQRGIALVITLLIVALLTIIVMEFTFSAHVDQQMGYNALNSLQATLLARSGIAEGEAVLLTDKDIQFDSYLEDWGRIDELDTQLVVPENMQLKVRVVDEMGKLNINKVRPLNRVQCQQFVDQVPASQPRMWLTALERIDPQVGEAADQYWTNLCEMVIEAQPGPGAPVPTRTPTGQPAGVATPETTPGAQDIVLPEFPTLDDAAAVMGFSAAAVRRLRPYVTALPAVGVGAAIRVNANTAPRRVLTAIIGDDGAAGDLISRRNDAVLNQGDIGALTASAASQNGEVTTQPNVMLGVQSSYFRIRASAIINANPTTGRGGIRRSASMLVQRKPRVGGPPAGSSPGAIAWTLVQLDWQKEGGAALFTEKPDDDSETGDMPDSEFSRAGG
jgi:type II secretory pathway component PulK